MREKLSIARLTVSFAIFEIIEMRTLIIYYVLMHFAGSRSIAGDLFYFQ